MDDVYYTSLPKECTNILVVVSFILNRTDKSNSIKIVIQEY